MRMLHALLVVMALALTPSIARAQSPLDACDDQFVDGLVANAPTIGNTAPDRPFASNLHLCYRDDGVSFFVLEYWPEQFAPRWAAYRLDPANYGANGCNTFTRGKANCYARKQTWAEFESCTKASDPFHADRMLSDPKLGTNPFYKTGHDRGHMAPRQAFSWHVCANYQTFSLANMSPQRAFLNQNIWRHLERQVLTWAFDEGPLFVVTGTTYRRFPVERFEIFTNGTFDGARVYARNTTMEEAVAQHAANFSDFGFDPGHPLKPKRNAKPDRVKAKVKLMRMPTGYYKVIFRPARNGEPPHAIGFLLPHTFENLNQIPNVDPARAFWAFVSRIDLIEETSGTRFPGVPENMKPVWGDDFFLSRRTARNIRERGCGTGMPQGVVPDTTKNERIAMCTNLLD